MPVHGSLFPERRRLLWECVLVLCTLLWAGCTPEDHYETLKIFFNDPPKPRKATTGPVGAGAETGHSGEAVAETKRFVHAPYRQGRCQACHGEKGASRLSALDSGKCMVCHEAVQRGYPAMHTAVADRACLWCHAPHEADLPGLARSSAPSLCVQCHDVALLGRSSHDPANASANCMDCHNPHGGTDRKLLRTAKASSDATTRPVPVAEKEAR